MDSEESKEYLDVQALILLLVFGVLTGVIFLDEEFTGSLMMGLPLVCAGIFLVNWKSKNIGIEMSE